MKRQMIMDSSFEGERQLFARSGIHVERVQFRPGESPLKHCTDVEVTHCDFMAKYPCWHNDRLSIENSRFHVSSRAALWYSQHVRIVDCQVEAPKMFRRVEYLDIENSRFTDAQETLWSCRNVRLRNVVVHNGDYLFMNGEEIHIEDFSLQGNYAFDGARNVVIRRANLASKDAFWNSENVTVFDSVLDGEYLGWHSRNLRLVNCRIRGTQPLCFATNLLLENCVMEADADLAFEHSTLQADIRGDIASVKNPAGGLIRARHIDEVILDSHCLHPGACRIEVAEDVLAGVQGSVTALSASIENT